MNKPTSAIADIHAIVDLAGDRAAVTVAADTARQLNAHLTGMVLAFEPLIPVYPAGMSIPTEAIVASREVARKDARKAASAFEEVAKRVGVPFGTYPLLTIVGEGFAELAEACRLSDLVVVGQSDPDGGEWLRPAVIETLLFNAVAPTLVVPYAGVNQLKLDRAIVAWDGSAQAARALRAAMPLLAMTGSVTVAMVEEASKWAGGTPGADIADHLARHGLRVDVQRLDNSLGDIGATLLNLAADMNADWMVMGAYGHTRVREVLLGGVTRGILGSMTVPVLMAH